MNMPSISIIIPVYNAAQTISATIESVLNQTFTEFELIAIDDGSRDLSLAVLMAYAETDSRIKIVSQANKGVAATRNMGIELSRAPIIAFLDADDLWHPKKLARHMAFHLECAEAAVSYARVAFVTHDEAVKSTSSIATKPLGVNALLAENITCTMSNLVVRRDVFETIGGFSETMSHAEDQEWLIRAASADFAIMGIDEILVDYRLSQDGLSVNLEQMYDGWRSLAARYHHSDTLYAAEAIYCRYLARRALRSGAQPHIAFGYAVRGLKIDAHAFLNDARRGWLTIASVLAASLMPRRARLRIFA